MEWSGVCHKFGFVLAPITNSQSYALFFAGAELWGGLFPFIGLERYGLHFWCALIIQGFWSMTHVNSLRRYVMWRTCVWHSSPYNDTSEIWGRVCGTLFGEWTIFLSPFRVHSKFWCCRFFHLTTHSIFGFFKVLNSWRSLCLGARHLILHTRCHLFARSVFLKWSHV